MPHASELEITGGWSCLALAVLAVLAVAWVPWWWDAWSQRRLGRTVTVLVAVMAVVVACAAEVNRLGSFYPTLGALIGTSSDPSGGTDVEAGQDGDRLAATRPIRVSRSRGGHGTTEHLTLTGRASHLTRDVDVYLPPGYDDPDAALRFPIVEWFPGFPGEPREVSALFGLPAMLDDAIARDRMPPTVVIIPDTNGEPRLSHDEECVDAVAGPADDRFLSDDVRGWALARLRVRADRAGWALAGWSSGGYCAMNLALRHPSWYSAAASQSGYDRTALDATTGDPFAGREDLRQGNDVSALLRAHPVPLSLLVAAGAAERDEQQAAERMRAAAAPPVELTRLTFPGGGHNTEAVRAQVPSILGWLGAHLAAPVAPDDHPAGTRVDQPGVLPWPAPDPDEPPS
ncbi:MAG TPA: alpha/beta hydrolase-fold protein [Actinomycetospora sp.]